jgi:hypothetical protein
MHHQDPAATRQHAQHDLTLIADLAADDRTFTDRTSAQSLVDACSECRALRDDLLAITGATRALPAPRAPRDYRLTPAQASRLRRTSWLGVLLAPFAGAHSVAKPLAATFTTLGLVGVFVAAAVPSLLGGASMAAPEAAPGAVGGPVLGTSATEAPAQLGPVASAGSEANGFGTKDSVEPSGDPFVGQAGGGDGRDLGTDGSGRADTPASPLNPLLVGSFGLLAAGLVLFGLRFAGRRLR